MTLMRVILLFFCLFGRFVWADVVLNGSMNIGDNTSSALLPSALFNSSFSPVYPIHFSISQSGTLTGIELNSVTSNNRYGVTFIIWDKRGNIVLNTNANDATPNKVPSLSVYMPAGDYQMAVFGACLQKNTSAKSQTTSCFNTNGQQGWDDIAFTNITLSGLQTTALNFIQRQHVGDSTLSRLYPPINSGSEIVYSFNLAARTVFNSVSLYRIQDLGDFTSDPGGIVSDGYRITIVDASWLFPATYFSQNISNNGDVNWSDQITLPAGSYELHIAKTNFFSFVMDDIAWDDIVIKTNIENAINHYQLEYTSNNISCLPVKVMIKACTTSGTSCTVDTTANSSVALTASPTSAWSTNPITLVNGVGSTSLSHYIAENVALGVNGATSVCLEDGQPDSNCQLPFVTSAFSFNIPTFYAGSDSGNVTIKALQASGANPAVCTTLFANQTPNINFSNQYVLPITGSKSPVLNGTTITSNTAVPVTFDNSGVGTIKLAYNNAGVLGISAQYTKTDATAGTLSIVGSDNVAVLPPQIQLTASGQTACSVPSDTLTSLYDQLYAACSKYKKAGETFTLSAQAGYGTSFVPTNNFTPESTAVKPSIEHKLVAPSTGSLPSSWTNTALTFSAGIASSSVSEGDVGVYQYQVNPFVPYPTYQDEATQLKVPKSTDDWSDSVGRFVPAQLKATIAANGSLTTDTCVAANLVSSTLGYTGQALQFATAPMLSVTALGSDGSTEMKNYQGNFAKITDMKAPGSANFVAALSPKNSTNSLTSTASWSDGSWATSGNAYTHIYNFSANNQFTFSKTSTPVIPFESSLVVSTLTDSDDVKATSSLPLTFNPVAPDGSTFKVYSGRLTLDSVNVAETSALTMPFYMQYWNGSTFALNTSDNCSSLNSTYLQMNAAANWSGINLRTSNSSSAPATTNASLSPAVVAQGAGAILFTAPNNTGWVDISASSSLPLWMQDLSFSSGLNPARASFGYYRGNDRLIYRREVFGGQ